MHSNVTKNHVSSLKGRPLLVEPNVENRQREALVEVRQVLEGVEPKSKDAKVRQLVRANVVRHPYQVMVEMKLHQGKTLKCMLITSRCI